jgi:hypothetical protein
MVDFEITASNNDNLFSTIDDANNTGISAKINAKQRLVSKKWNLDATTNYQFIQQSFRSVERLYSIFDRDWNLNTTIATGDQSLFSASLFFNYSLMRAVLIEETSPTNLKNWISLIPFLEIDIF